MKDEANQIIFFIPHPSSFIPPLPAILDLLFVFVNLVLDAIERQLDGGHDLFMLIAGHKVVFVFGIDQDFHLFVDLIGQVDGDVDHGDPVKEVKKAFGLFADFLLMIIVQMPVSGAYSDLHGHRPPRVMRQTLDGFGAFPIWDCS
jgi:hypothetical protein